MVLNLSMSRPGLSNLASLPLMPTLRGKEWESAVAESPVRHALFDKPFSSLRRKTEVLLDQITGGTLPPSVHEEERKQKEEERQLRCRNCRIVFGDERGLNKHLDLFPAHVHAPEYKRKSRRRKSQRSHSTSDVLTSQSASRPKARHSRAETMAAGPSLALNEIESGVTIANLDPSELYAPVPAESATAAAVPAIADGAAPIFTSPPPVETIDTSSGSTNYDSFQIIRHNTGLQLDHSRPISRRQDRPVTPSHSDYNQAAGAASSMKFAARQEHARQLTRGASESALDNMSIPTSVREVAKAIIATGKGGALEPAMTPSAERELSIKAQSMYRPLWGEEEEGGGTPKVLTVRNKSSIDWSSLQAPLPGAPEKNKEKPKRNELEPVATGLTSFSDDASPPPPPSFTKSISTSAIPMISRRKTNPFLNEAFMNSLTSTTQSPNTPSPSSPFARQSPGNPFNRLADAEMSNYNDDFGGDREEQFYDPPQTPLPIFDETKVQSNNPFFFSSEVNQESEEAQEPDYNDYYRPKTPNPISSTKKQHQPILKKSRSVHFDQETSLKASDSPRCPSCRRAFIDLRSVLYHIDNTDCNPFNLSEGQLLSAY